MIFSGSKVKIYYVDKDRITERKKMFTSSELIYGWKQCTVVHLLLRHTHGLLKKLPKTVTLHFENPDKKVSQSGKVQELVKVSSENHQRLMKKALVRTT